MRAKKKTLLIAEGMKGPSSSSRSRSEDRSVVGVLSVCCVCM